MTMNDPRTENFYENLKTFIDCFNTKFDFPPVKQLSVISLLKKMKIPTFKEVQEETQHSVQVQVSDLLKMDPGKSFPQIFLQHT